MRRAHPLRLVLVLLLAVACQAPDTPAQRYARFAEAARGGSRAAVWAMLSKGSQEKLRARAQELLGPISGRELDARAAGLLVGDLAPTAPKVKSVTMLRESRDQAVVSVEVEGGPGRDTGEVTLVREGEQWKIVLP